MHSGYPRHPQRVQHRSVALCMSSISVRDLSNLEVSGRLWTVGKKSRSRSSAEKNDCNSIGGIARATSQKG
ncbi:unnamed protein product [Calypogeia fissa]